MWLWITAFGIGIGVVYGLDVPNHIQCKNFTALGDAIYGGFYKLAWALAVGWVIFACCRGYGGKKIVNFVDIYLYLILCCYSAIFHKLSKTLLRFIGQLNSI